MCFFCFQKLLILKVTLSSSPAIFQLSMGSSLFIVKRYIFLLFPLHLFALSLLLYFSIFFLLLYDKENAVFSPGFGSSRGTIFCQSHCYARFCTPGVPKLVYYSLKVFWLPLMRKTCFKNILVVQHYFYTLLLAFKSAVLDFLVFWYLFL